MIEPTLTIYERHLLLKKLGMDTLNALDESFSAMETPKTMCRVNSAAFRAIGAATLKQRAPRVDSVSDSPHIAVAACLLLK